LYGSQNQAVIPGFKETVAYGQIPAGININTVIIDHFLITDYLNAVNIDLFTGDEPESPAGGVYKRGVFDPYITTVEEDNHARPVNCRFGVKAS
jgi:hypothetical protein